MRKITEVVANEDFTISLVFENEVKKTFDIKPYLELPVFRILKSKDNFYKIKNSNYFVEWPNFEIDLSADTLWHGGI